MSGPLTITGVCGWAIPPAWLERQISIHFPKATVKALYPETPGDRDEATRLIKNNPAQLWVGYSLGTLWLLHHFRNLPPQSRLALLCPVSGFTREMERGGKTRRVQLNYLIRRFKRNPENLAPAFEFLNSISLSIDECRTVYPISTDALMNGLEFLASTSILNIPEGISFAAIGEHDPLMDPQILLKDFPQLEIIPDAGHHPEPLLKKLATRTISGKAG